MTTTPAQDLRRQAAIHPEREALLDGALRLSFRQLDESVDQLASALETAGAMAGDRVCLCLGNSFRFVRIYLACSRLGLTVVPLSVGTPPGKLDQLLQHADARFVFSENDENGRTLASADESVLIRKQNLPGSPGIAVINYTSGTTGAPKAVTLSHAAMSAVADAGTSFVGLDESDRVAITTPLFHLYALREIDSAVRAGACLVLLRNLTFPAKVLGQFAAEKVTGVASVPSAAQLFMHERYAPMLASCQSLRFFALGTAPSPKELLGGLKGLLPRTRLLVTYGLTEASRVCYREVEDPDLYYGSVGKPYVGVEVDVLDEQGDTLPGNKLGRVVIRSPMLMDGYWRDPERSRASFLEDGRLLTPDCGSLDTGGRLFLAGRFDDMMNAGGEKISPDEIEAVLRQHPSVAEAAVVQGRMDDVFGEHTIRAYLQLRSAEALDEGAFIRFCAEHLDRHKIPTVFERVRQFPRTALGKIAKNRITEGAGA